MICLSSGDSLLYGVHGQREAWATAWYACSIMHLFTLACQQELKEEEGGEDSYWDTPLGSRELRPTPETLRSAYPKTPYIYYDIPLCCRVVSTLGLSECRCPAEITAVLTSTTTDAASGFLNTEPPWNFTRRSSAAAAGGVECESPLFPPMTMPSSSWTRYITSPSCPSSPPYRYHRSKSSHSSARCPPFLSPSPRALPARRRPTSSPFPCLPPCRPLPSPTSSSTPRTLPLCPPSPPLSSALGCPIIPPTLPSLPYSEG